MSRRISDAILKMAATARLADIREFELHVSRFTFAELVDELHSNDAAEFSSVQIATCNGMTVVRPLP